MSDDETSLLAVPHEFANWCYSLPDKKRKVLSIHELRSIYEHPQLRAENQMLKSRADKLLQDLVRADDCVSRGLDREEQLESRIAALEAAAREMEKRISHIDDCTRIQTGDGTWNYDLYHFGMANGLILARALMRNEEPQYLNKPERWLAEADAGKASDSEEA